MQAQVQKTQQVTEQQSLTLMKNLVRTSISTICYLRGLFDEECFKDNQMTGIKIKQLVSGSPNKEATLLVAWLEKGVFDALKRKFLDKIVFAVYGATTEQQPEELLEAYQFGFNYLNGEEGFTMTTRSDQFLDVRSKTAIKKSTMTMMRTLVMLGNNLRPVPKKRYLTMKLLYRDQYTPEGYEPEFFRPCNREEYMRFYEKPIKIEIGKVQTPYHEIGFSVKALEGLFEENNLQEDQPLENESEMSDSSSKPPCKDGIAELESTFKRGMKLNKEEHERTHEEDVSPTDPYEDFKSYVLSSKCTSISVGKLKKQFKTDDTTVKNFLSHMHEEGLVKKNGKRYHLIVGKEEALAQQPHRNQGAKASKPSHDESSNTAAPVHKSKALTSVELNSDKEGMKQPMFEVKKTGITGCVRIRSKRSGPKKVLFADASRPGEITCSQESHHDEDETQRSKKRRKSSIVEAPIVQNGS
eukprot:g29600.t1